MLVQPTWVMKAWCGVNNMLLNDNGFLGYGSIFEVTGNAASPIQFHVTDSVKHFITGAVYFSVQPNYDSIKPAISYLQNDVVRMIESMEWKN